MAYYHGGMATLELEMKQIPTYRIEKIEIKRGDAIDQIKIMYDDGTAGYIGHDCGQTDPRCLVMTEGEHLTRVTHERLFNYDCAGAAVEFETNKGRIFSYKPLEVATKWKNEETTIRAHEGREIIGLIIRRGILLGSVQQPVASNEFTEHPKSWYVIASQYQKEEDILSGSDDVTYRHFYSKSEAFKKWKEALSEVNGKKGRGAMLVDCIKSQVLEKGGSADVINVCTDKLIEDSYCTPRNEENVSRIQIILILCKFLATWSDIWKFILTSTFMVLAYYLSIESQIITGHVLSLVESNQTSLREANRFVNFTCNYLVNCNDSSLSIGKALVVSYIAIRTIESFVFASKSYLELFMFENKARELKRDVFARVLSLDQHYFDKNSTYQIYDSMNVWVISDFIFWLLPELIAGTFQYMMIAYYLIAIDVYLGSFCVLIMVGSRFALHHIRKYEELFKKFERKLDIINGQIQGNVLCAISCVKSFSKEGYHIKEHNMCQQRVIDNIVGTIIFRCIREFLGDILQTVTFGVAIYIGLQYFTHSKMTSGELTGFFLLLNQFHGNSDRIKMFLDYLSRNYRSIEQFKLLMEEEATMTDGPIKPNKIHGAVTFKDVHFEYPSRPKDKVLKGLNLSIQPHKMTAIVGDSGAGKSTIAKLIMRMYDVTSGSIIIDGHDIKMYDRKELHRFMGIVSQNPTLFDTSLAENIGYGAVEDVYTNKQIQDVAKLSNLEFISKFRAGFDTHAGSSGSQLSGGQKQRIAIARAAIRDPSILILDEATSSLDAQNEKEVQEALENIMAGRTIIVIAHRLSTIKNADEIICMKDGQVVERGTHDELMLREGVYHDLILKQIVEKKENNLLENT